MGGTRRKLPGVGAYKLDNSPLRQTNGGYMGSKLGSCFSQNKNNEVPGPGEYNVSSIDLSNSGNYVLSNFKYILRTKAETLITLTIGLRQNNQSIKNIGG